MQRTREELEELLRKSQENLKKSRSAQRKLKAVMTKVNKVIGRRKSAKGNRRSNIYRFLAGVLSAVDRRYDPFLPMPVRRCPKCHEPGRLLADASKDADVYDYRCDACGHVWSHLKRDPNAPAVSHENTSASVGDHRFSAAFFAASTGASRTEVHGVGFVRVMNYLWKSFIFGPTQRLR
jgi:predicted nucleic acid-binding Zn ribbon protein